MKTNWDLTLFYKSTKDPQIEKDLDKIEKLILDFEKKYKDSDEYLKYDSKLFDALSDWEKLEEFTGAWRPLLYFYFNKYLDSSNKKFEAKINLFSDKLNKLNNKLLFFELALGKIPQSRQKKFLQSDKLKHFHYYLERIFENAKYDLSEPEEKILNLKAQTSRSMWVRGMEGILNKQEVRHKGKSIPVSEASNLLPELGTKERRQLGRKIYKVFYDLGDFAEAEVNAVITDKKINDELRGFKNPYDATFISYENDEDEVFNMVNAVIDNYDLSHTFYSLKAKLLDLRFLRYADRSAKVGDIKHKYTHKESLDLLRRVYSNLGPKYEEILERFVSDGHIDVFPKKGKASGAFCAGSVNVPTMVLLNHVDSFSSVRTFAHEMGHAIHTEFSKVQSPLYQNYSTATAETASTLFEDFVFEELLKHLDKDDQILALHNKINEEIATIFRQVAFFNFERDLHAEVRNNGFASKEKIAELMNKHMAAYLGPKFKFEDLDGYFFVYLSHIRRYFYVYSYAYGRLISKVMYEKYEDDPGYLQEIEKFLSAGGSKSPKNIFAEIGIDTTDSKFWEIGLNGIEEDIDRLSELVKE